jgi:hypothetical protein
MMLNGIPSVTVTGALAGAAGFAGVGGGGAVVIFALFTGSGVTAGATTGSGVTAGFAEATAFGFFVIAGSSGIFFGSRMASISAEGTWALLRRITSAEVRTKSVFDARI